MKKIVFSFIVIFLTSALSACAEHKKNEQLETALQECSNSVEQNDNGKANREAFEKCMSEKGFEKPRKKDFSGKHGEKPPMPPNLKE